MKSRVLILAVALMVLFVPAGNGLMEYFGADVPMPHSPGWPGRLRELVNSDARVLGIMGPIAATRVHYAGDTAELNAFLKDYAKVPDSRLEVVLHPGRRTCRVPRPETTEQIVDVDWSLHISEYYRGRKDQSFEGKKALTTLDVWFGGGIELHKLDVPPSIDVRSDGEIERFVERHKEKRKKRADGC